jgi:cytochrome c peroxidase
MHARPGKFRYLLLTGALLLLAAGYWRYASGTAGNWTESEQDVLRSLWIGSLAPLLADPTNRVAANPQAATLGHQLFFDTRLSGPATIACATCHQPQLDFTDGLPQARAIGQARRNTPSLLGVAYSPWYYWDGRKDSLWAQALAPMEHPAEQGSNRMRIARLVTEDPHYRQQYAALFGTLPDFSDRARFSDDAAPGANPLWNDAWESMAQADRQLVSAVFANAGKVLAAYESKLLPGPSRFDAYVNAVLHPDNAAAATYSSDEIAGLRLFIGAARCIECHNGPLFTNNEFHNTGLLPLAGLVPDLGRSSVLRQVLEDPFNCLGSFSDAAVPDCPELTHMRTGLELLGAQRTPSLRNLAHTAPYMHMGQIATLAEVLEHYNEAPPALVGHNEAEPLRLSQRQLRQLEAFLLTLQAPPATDPAWLVNPHAEN